MGAEKRPLVLCVLDGFGEREAEDGNAVRLAVAPHLSAIRATCPMALLEASGEAVGLPKGQMGNSEVGHLNLGAGRVAPMDLSRIDVAVAQGALGRNQVIADLLHRARFARVSMPGLHEEPRVARVHLFGLVSDGGVHSSLSHLFALIDEIAHAKLPIVVHAFLDGRDTPPKSALKYIDHLEFALRGKGVIGTIAGRYFAMDRDNRWDRVQKAFRAIVRGDDTPTQPTAHFAIESAYEHGQSDEFVEPVRIGAYSGMYGSLSSEFGGGDATWTWRGEEAGICFNFRPDRMRELVSMLLRKNLPNEGEEAARIEGRPTQAFDPHMLISLTEYDKKLDTPVAFPKEQVLETFGEVISKHGLRQFRCAETEKYAHVTYFFNGGREAAFAGEERWMAASPRDVPTYDKKPEMSANEVTDKVVFAIESGEFDFVLVNYANPDMVGHTGNLEAATRAVEAVDVGIGKIRAALEAKHGILVVTADHGNCETMVDVSGEPHTAHTTNPVPLYLVGAPARRLASSGKLADVAPTLLRLLGIEPPSAMTGTSLLQ